MGVITEPAPQCDNEWRALCRVLSQARCSLSHPTGKEKAKFHAARGGLRSHLAIQGHEGVHLHILQQVFEHSAVLLLLSQTRVK